MVTPLVLNIEFICPIVLFLFLIKRELRYFEPLLHQLSVRDGGGQNAKLAILSC